MPNWKLFEVGYHSIRLDLDPPVVRKISAFVSIHGMSMEDLDDENGRTRSIQ